jgi:hypothetical protein
MKPVEERSDRPQLRDVEAEGQAKPSHLQWAMRKQHPIAIFRYDRARSVARPGSIDCTDTGVQEGAR